MHETPFEVVTVRGAVLQPDAEILERAVTRVSRAGTRATVVDLDGVTHLGSAAVQVLHWLMDGQAGHIALTATNGSVAQHVLDLVNLPYDRTAGRRNTSSRSLLPQGGSHHRSQTRSSASTSGSFPVMTMSDATSASLRSSIEE